MAVENRLIIVMACLLLLYPMGKVRGIPGFSVISVVRFLVPPIQTHCAIFSYCVNIPGLPVFILLSGASILMTGCLS